MGGKKMNRFAGWGGLDDEPNDVINFVLQSEWDSFQELTDHADKLQTYFEGKKSKAGLAACPVSGVQYKFNRVSIRGRLRAWWDKTQAGSSNAHVVARSLQVSISTAAEAAGVAGATAWDKIHAACGHNDGGGSPRATVLTPDVSAGRVEMHNKLINSATAGLVGLAKYHKAQGACDGTCNAELKAALDKVCNVAVDPATAVAFNAWNGSGDNHEDDVLTRKDRIGSDHTLFNA